MLLEGIAPDDIARTMGISARALRRRRTTIRDRLANLPQSAWSRESLSLCLRDEAPREFRAVVPGGSGKPLGDGST
jgi:hypothetical protein